MAAYKGNYEESFGEHVADAAWALADLAARAVLSLGRGIREIQSFGTQSQVGARLRVALAQAELVAYVPSVAAPAPQAVEAPAALQPDLVRPVSAEE